MSAREKILNRIRAVTSEVSGGNPVRRIAEPPRLIRPDLGSDLVQRFGEKLALGGGSLARVQDLQRAVIEIERFLRDAELPLRLRAAPALWDFPWGDALEVSFGPSIGNDLVSVTPAFCAIAESGSVVLLSGEHSPTTLNFLPDVHIVVLESSQLVRHFEDAWARLRESGEIPRTVNIITGPSKTADIEQTLQVGAHGPRKLHVIWIDGTDDGQTPT